MAGSHNDNIYACGIRHHDFIIAWPITLPVTTLFKHIQDYVILLGPRVCEQFWNNHTVLPCHKNTQIHIFTHFLSLYPIPCQVFHYQVNQKYLPQSLLLLWLNIEYFMPKTWAVYCTPINMKLRKMGTIMPQLLMYSFSTTRYWLPDCRIFESR